MERCKDKMVEMPPEEILTEREGVAYPSFVQLFQDDIPVESLLLMSFRMNYLNKK